MEKLDSLLSYILISTGYIFEDREDQFSKLDFFFSYSGDSQFPLVDDFSDHLQFWNLVESPFLMEEEDLQFFLIDKMQIVPD